MSDPAKRASNPFDRVVGPWERVIDDMHATAERYREADQTVIECHPGDVATLTGEPLTAAEMTGDVDPGRRTGLDAVLPGEEFEAVRTVLRARDPDRVEVFRATGNGLVFLLLSLWSGDSVVMLPLYYDRQEADTLRTIASDGGFPVHVRPLVDDERVSVTIDDPEPCFP
ncbi:hypothetical protein GOC74_00950 [Halomicrobium mukohataei]|uniref:Uncharacterized protein n=1 Tax=Halomicrobium mukohataei TaxID=57705 RepID=A0A847UB91_9EURY|nr:hypothetical protein [Halomicrobium mukohataei]NLV08504.1 hypothetical protein [Halomicrobium mukohataei]